MHGRRDNIHYVRKRDRQIMSERESILGGKEIDRRSDRERHTDGDRKMTD